MPARITCKTAEGVKNCIVKQYNLFGGETKTINNIVFAQSLRAGGVQRFPRCAIRLQNNDGNYIEFGDGLCLNFFRLQVVKDINLYLQRGGNFEGAYRDYVTALVGLFCLFLAGGLYKLRFGKEK
ncbi:MAG: hypothetical protein LBL61_03930 [Elusimicrobiota bacterium]|nr:hypothetical protein [Elusimicrobiota bacterium]